ncbi:MAG: hypothetical protein HS115_01950 [Spirochaetales bacterium]|nr:hypothetical protein [Spirochaetales bacterium]
MQKLMHDPVRTNAKLLNKDLYLDRPDFFHAPSGIPCGHPELDSSRTHIYIFHFRCTAHYWVLLPPGGIFPAPAKVQ